MAGHTIEVLHNHHAERLRLNGIGCPENGQAYGKKAKQAASALVYGQAVTLQSHGKDKYRRTIAEVLLANGTDYAHACLKELGSRPLTECVTKRENSSPFRPGSYMVTPTDQGGRDGRPHFTHPRWPAELEAGASSVTLIGSLSYLSFPREGTTATLCLCSELSVAPHEPPIHM